MKRFSEYSLEIRAAALAEARESHGLLCWERTFDQDNPIILAICQRMEGGA